MAQISERRNFDKRLRTKNLTLPLMDFARDIGLVRDEFQVDEYKELRELTDRR